MFNAFPNNAIKHKLEDFSLYLCIFFSLHQDAEAHFSNLFGIIITLIAFVFYYLVMLPLYV